MKLILLKNNLLGALTSVERAIGENINLPILKNFLLKADDGKISLVSTNLELAITHFISAKIIESGVFTAPLNIFKNIISNINSERITLEQKEKQLTISTDNYEAILQTQNPKEYPLIPAIQNTKQTFQINESEFKESLAQVVVATQYSEIRPEISGVFLAFQENEVVFVATDSFRLAEKKISSAKVKTNFEKFAVTIPLKTAHELLRVLKDSEEDLEIYIDSNQILFKTKEQEIVSRLIDGGFPDYRAIIPRQTTAELTLQRDELMRAVKLTSSFSGRASDITLRVGENKKFLELYSADSALGENRYKIPIKFKGERISIVFNWRYLLDGLRIYKTEEIVLGVNAADRPVLIKGQSESGTTYVLMPIKS